MFLVFSSPYNLSEVINDIDALNVPVKQVNAVQGAYNGKEEPAFIVHCQYDAVPKLIDLVLQEYDQEAVLVVDNNYDCKMFTIGHGAIGVDVGRWHNVHQDVALSRDAYTRIGQVYYVVD